MKSNRISVLARLVVLALGLGVLLGGHPLRAQGERMIEEEAPSAVSVDIEKPKIALWLQIHGCKFDKTKDKIIPSVYRDVFKDFEIAPDSAVDSALAQLDLRKDGGKPTDRELLKAGQALNVDYMLYAGMEVETKRPWVLFGPRAKSTVKMDTVVIDVEGNRVIHDPAKQIGFSQGRGDAQTAVAVLVSPIGAVFMGGHLDTAEEKAVTSTIEDCYSPFFQRLRERVTLIEDDEA